MRRWTVAWDRYGVVALVAAGGAMRLALASRATIVEHDGAYYANLGAALLRGDLALGLSTLWPPLYPAAIAAAAWPVAGAMTPERLEWVARLVSVVAGTLSLVLLHRWAARVLGRDVAGIALTLAAFHPRLVQYSASALTESTFAALLLAGLVLLAEREPAPERGRLRSLAAGIAFGLAYLARPEGLLLGIAAATGMSTAGMTAAGTEPSERRAHRHIPWAFAIGLVVTILPWIVFLDARLGTWSFGEKGAYNFWREYKSEYRARLGEPPGLSERAYESPELIGSIPPAPVAVVEFVRAEPGVVLRRSLANLGRIVISSIPGACYPAYFAFAVLGCAALARPALRPAAAMLIALPVFYAPFTDDRRFFVPAVPWILALAAAGIVKVASWLPAPRRSRAVLALVTLFGITGATYTFIHPLMDVAPEHRAAGTWLRTAWRGAPPIVMSRKTWVAFYAGGLLAEVPEGGLDSVLARIARKRADVLVVDARWAVPHRPELAALLDPASAPAGFRPLLVLEHPRRLVLYDVREARLTVARRVSRRS